MRWFSQGDRNSKYFHSYVKGKRRRLFLHEIHNDPDEVIRGNSDIGNEAVSFFSK